MFKYLVLVIAAWQAFAGPMMIDGKAYMNVDGQMFPLETSDLSDEEVIRINSKSHAEEIAFYRSTISPQASDLKFRMSSVKNQGPRGSCSAFQAVGLVEQFVNKNIDFSEQCLIGLSTGVDRGHPFDRLKFILRNGLHYESNCPYVDPANYREWPNANEAQQEELRQRALRSLPDLSKTPPVAINARLVAREHKDFTTSTLLDYIRGKINSGRPVGISTIVAGKGWDDGVIRHIPTETELERMCRRVSTSSSSKKNCASHAVVLTGFDDSRGVFYFKNSWKDNWGVNKDYKQENFYDKKTGYGIISYEYFAKFGIGKLVTLE